MVGERVQFFPKDRWREEFALAKQLRLSAIELTIEAESYEDHPIRTQHGRDELTKLSANFDVNLAGLCCDVFMHWPLVSEETSVRRRAFEVLSQLCRDAGALGLPMIEIPMLGANSATKIVSAASFLDDMKPILELAQTVGVALLLEADLAPTPFRRLLDAAGGRLGVNYDMGNSAYFGFSSAEEVAAYGPYIQSVHVKDCTPQDYSVVLGRGNVPFESLFAHLQAIQYGGLFILQTYRDPGADPIEEIAGYREFLEPLMSRYGFSTVEDRP